MDTHWTGLPREDIVEWIAARDGALAWLDWTRLSCIKLNCTGLASVTVLSWTALDCSALVWTGLPKWRQFCRRVLHKSWLNSNGQQSYQQKDTRFIWFISLDWWTSPHRAGLNRTGPYQIRRYIYFFFYWTRLLSSFWTELPCK